MKDKKLPTWTELLSSLYSPLDYDDITLYRREREECMKSHPSNFRGENATSDEV